MCARQSTRTYLPTHVVGQPAAQQHRCVHTHTQQAQVSSVRQFHQPMCLILTHPPTLPSRCVRLSQHQAHTHPGGRTQLPQGVVRGMRSWRRQSHQTVVNTTVSPAPTLRLVPINSCTQICCSLMRQVDGLRVFGVAIPTVAGLRRVLNSMGAQRGGNGHAEFIDACCFCALMYI